MITAVVLSLRTLVTESHSTPIAQGHWGPIVFDPPPSSPVKTRRPLVVLGRLSFVDALTDISRVLTGRVNEEAIQRACEQRLREKVMVFARTDPDVEHMIRELRARDVRLGVISNGFAEDVHHWSTWPLAREFECRSSSARRARNHDPEIYRQAMRELGVEPATTVYVGDGGDDELAGAERAGLRAFRAAWFSRSAQNSLDYPALSTCDELRAHFV